MKRKMLSFRTYSKAGTTAKSADRIARSQLSFPAHTLKDPRNPLAA